MQWQAWPLARQAQLRTLTLAAQEDLTGDGGQEILLADLATGHMLALRWAESDYELITLPGRCSGPFLVHDENADGIPEIVRGGCTGGERWSILWGGESFYVSDSR